MAGTKGKGTQGYVDTDDDDQYRVVPCVTVVTPPGYERAIQDGEPCLGDTTLEQDTGDLKRTPIVGTMRWTANEATIENALETCIKNDTPFNFAIKLPYSTPVYLFAAGKLTKLSPQQIDRDKFISRDFEFLPTEAWTYSGTAPTLEA